VFLHGIVSQQLEIVAVSTPFAVLASLSVAFALAIDATSVYYLPAAVYASADALPVVLGLLFEEFRPRDPCPSLRPLISRCQVAVLLSLACAYAVVVAVKRPDVSYQMWENSSAVALLCVLQAGVFFGSFLFSRAGHVDVHVTQGDRGQYSTTHTHLIRPWTPLMQLWRVVCMGSAYTVMVVSAKIVMQWVRWSLANSGVAYSSNSVLLLLLTLSSFAVFGVLRRESYRSDFYYGTTGMVHLFSICSTFLVDAVFLYELSAEYFIGPAVIIGIFFGSIVTDASNDADALVR
jgi:hypothetical protein